MITLYGIKNCNTVKKAMIWLTDRGINFQFHDYKKDGVNKTKLSEFVQKFGWTTILNRNGTTWRQLDKQEQDKITNNELALKLMLEKPSIIKRPILDLESTQLVGFEISEYENTFAKIKKS